MKKKTRVGEGEEKGGIAASLLGTERKKS